MELVGLACRQPESAVSVLQEDDGCYDEWLGRDGSQLERLQLSTSCPPAGPSQTVGSNRIACLVSEIIHGEI